LGRSIESSAAPAAAGLQEEVRHSEVELANEHCIQGRRLEQDDLQQSLIEGLLGEMSGLLVIAHNQLKYNKFRTLKNS
jgi:hypothetical protein